MSYLDTLKLQGKLGFWFDYRQGSVRDLSGNALPATVAGGGQQWGRTDRGRGIITTRTLATSYGLAVPADFTSQGSVFCAYQHIVPASATYQCLLVKQNWGGARNGYGIYSDATSMRFTLADAAGAEERAFLLSTMRGRVCFFGMTWSATVRRVFLNGAQVDSVVPARLPTPVGQTLVVGAQGGSYGILNPLLVAFGANVALTQAEVARLYTDWLDELVLPAPPNRIAYSYPSMRASEYTAKGIVLDSPMERGNNGFVVDYTGGYAGELLSNPAPGPEGEGQTFDGVNDGCRFGDVTQLNGASKAVIEWVFKAEEATITNGDSMWAKGVVANRRFNAEFGAGGGVCAIKNACENGAGTYGITAAIVRARTWNHAVLVFDGTQVADADKLKLYLNGEYFPYSGILVGPIPATLYNNAGVQLYVGEETAGSNPSNITCKMFRARAGVSMSTAEVRSAYVENWARRIDWQAPGEDIPVSLVASVGAGACLGEWRVISGTWKVSEDATGKRWLECVTAGCVVTPQPNAFGSLHFTVWRNADVATSMLIQFQASTPTTYLGATQNGYCFYIPTNRSIVVAKVAAGVVSVVLSLTAAGYVSAQTSYDIFISRRPSDGRFTTYLRGGAYANWTLLNSSGGGSNPSAAEASYVASSWVSLNFAAGDKLLIHDPDPRATCRHPTHWQGQLDPTAGELPR